MKIPSLPFAIALLPPLFLLPKANAEVHPATASPSGRYRLASEPSFQQAPNGSKAELGAVISLVGRDGALLSKCYTPSRHYLAGPAPAGKESGEPKAYWNSDESLVAVYSEGRTWSRVDFYSVAQDRIAILPRPNWQFSLLKDLKEYTGTNRRLYERFVKWTGKDTCALDVEGTAVLKESQPDPYPLFDYRVTLRISVDGIQITEVKNTENH